MRCPLRDRIEVVVEAGKKAEDLTRQLLAFSRRQTLRMEPVDIGETVAGIAKMLRRMVREDIILELHTAPTRSVLADRAQIEQVIINLVVNARDAMPEGGTVIIGTSELELAAAGELSEIPAGAYVVISVSDTGIGMSRELREKIFEPFFTTKEMGKGTGLGLSSVFGIVKQHNGHVSVYSEPGKGTTFRIYLPGIDRDAVSAGGATAHKFPHGTGTILVVDDDSAVRRVIVDTLQPLGYLILEASGGKEALAINEIHAGTIQVLLTDVIMPHMNGWELADKIKARHPGVKVMYMSGYTHNTIANHGALEKGVVFLQKPLKLTELTEKVRELTTAGLGN